VLEIDNVRCHYGRRDRDQYPEKASLRAAVLSSNPEKRQSSDNRKGDCQTNKDVACGYQHESFLPKSRRSFQGPVSETADPFPESRGSDVIMEET
jgi:hypothetical protein